MNTSQVNKKSIEENFLRLSEELHRILIDKYQLPYKPFSAEELSINAFKLKFKKSLSYELINRILNVQKTIKHETFSENSLEELKDLLNLMRRKKIKSATQSKLFEVFKTLSIQSKDAIINENEFDEYKEYMHIRRPIERKIEDKFINHIVVKQKSLLFLVGNVGDGKSHLLSYINKRFKKEFNNYNVKIHNDATETKSPQKTAIETLLELLEPYSDENLFRNESQRLIIAINLGVLTNLLTVMKQTQKFTQMVHYIESTNVVSNRKIKDIQNEIFTLISFRENTNFIYDGNKLKSDFYEEALDRVFGKYENNPFYVAYKEDMISGVENILHYNYGFMMRKEFQKSLSYLLIKAEIEYKEIISVRDLFNLFYEICAPRDERESYDSYLPFLLFDNSTKSRLLQTISYFDPAKSQTRKIDEIALKLYHATNTYDEVLELLEEERNTFKRVFEPFKTKEKDFDNFINNYLRIKFLLNYNDELFNNEIFSEYVKLYHTIKNQGDFRKLIMLITKSMERWNGESPKENHIVRETSNSSVKLILNIKLKPEKPYTQSGIIIFPFIFKDDKYHLEVDFQVFKVLKKIERGYFLKEEDYQNAVQFDRFVNFYLYSNELLEENILYDLDSNNMYDLVDQYGQLELNKKV